MGTNFLFSIVAGVPNFNTHRFDPYHPNTFKSPSLNRSRKQRCVSIGGGGFQIRLRNKSVLARKCACVSAREHASVLCWLSMAVMVGIVSQKGGVGKSTVARLIAREYAAAGWNVKIADLDISQATSTDWKKRREQAELTPVVAVEPFRTVEQAVRVAPHYDLLVFDGPPHSMSGTKEIARVSGVVILPTGLSLDDLKPSVLLAHELIDAGVRVEKIAFALCRVGDRETEITEARNYIEKAGYEALRGELPERTAYRRASDGGRALSEASHPTLRVRAEELAQSIIDFVTRETTNNVNEAATSAAGKQ